MQVIEKVKVVPEGYNGAGMDGMYGRRDVNGKANAGLTLGIIGTALGAWALFGNRRSTGVLGTGAGLMGDGSTNINVEKWFGKGNFDDMIFESAIDFWFDDVDFGEDKLWKYFNELK